LGYVGLQAEIINKMRKLSKKGRTYIFYKRGEPAFILHRHVSVLSFFNDYQFMKHAEAPKCDTDPEEIRQGLVALPSDAARLTYLFHSYKHLYMTALNAMSLNDDKAVFLHYCKQSYELYTLYVAFGLEPHLELLGSQGKLRLGETKVNNK